jgi:metal-responsive CopG/Arc/MetJ family transcriptional regulator
MDANKLEAKLDKIGDKLDSVIEKQNEIGISNAVIVADQDHIKEDLASEKQNRKNQAAQIDAIKDIHAEKYVEAIEKITSKVNKESAILNNRIDKQDKFMKLIAVIAAATGGSITILFSKVGKYLIN